MTAPGAAPEHAPKGSTPQGERRRGADRRSGQDRRRQQIPVAVERRSGLDRRTHPDRRTSASRGGDLGVDADTVEFIQAVNRFKAQSGRPFPTWSELLQILRSLGYEKRPG